MSLHTISVELLKEAITIKEQIVALEQKLEKFLGDVMTPTLSEEAPAKKARKGMSKAAKAKISAAAKARWAKVKPAKMKKLSAKGRSAIGKAGQPPFQII